MGKDEVAEAMAYHDEMMEEYNKKKAEKMTGKVCEVCQTPLYSDPGAHELGIYLHAKRYACDQGRWAYETGLPEWALPPAGMDGPVEVTEESDPMALVQGVVGLSVGQENRSEADGIKQKDDEKAYIEPSRALGVVPG